MCEVFDLELFYHLLIGFRQERFSHDPMWIYGRVSFRQSFGEGLARLFASEDVITDHLVENECFLFSLGHLDGEQVIETIDEDVLSLILLLISIFGLFHHTVLQLSKFVIQVLGEGLRIDDHLTVLNFVVQWNFVQDLFHLFFDVFFPELNFTLNFNGVQIQYLTFRPAHNQFLVGCRTRCWYLIIFVVFVIDIELCLVFIAQEIIPIFCLLAIHNFSRDFAVGQSIDQ